MSISNGVRGKAVPSKPAMNGKAAAPKLAAQYAATVVSLAAFMVVSSLLIIINKQVLVDDGFHYPFALTCLGQFVSALSVLPLIFTGVVKVKPPPSLRDLKNKLLPTAVCSAVTMFTGNIAYLYLSVAFIQILKAFTPAMTLAVLVAMGHEALSPVVLLAVFMIAVGTGGSALIESSTPAFHLFGFLAFLLSAASEAGRVVLFQISMGKMNYNVFETLVYLSPVTCTILFILSVLTEGEAMIAPGGGFDKMLARPGLYVAATALSVLVNLTTYVAIRQSSSLTFKVVGCVKNAALVILGVTFMGERISLYQGIGYSFSIAGFMLYTTVRMQQPPPKDSTKKTE